MDQYVTRQILKIELKDLKQGLHTAFAGFRGEMRQETAELKGQFSALAAMFSSLQSSVDHYLKLGQDWRQEHIILKARHDRLSDALTTKGVVSKDEISL